VCAQVCVVGSCVHARPAGMRCCYGPPVTLECVLAANLAVWLSSKERQRTSLYVLLSLLCRERFAGKEVFWCFGVSQRSGQSKACAGVGVGVC
jgi:hypothetical protein